MILVYQILLGLALFVIGPFYLLRRHAHYGETLPGRFTFRMPPRPEGARGEAPLWIHAVSVGEVGVAATLAGALPAGTPLLVTTVTPTGQQQARTAFEKRAATTIAYLPFDLGLFVRRFLDHYQPRALLLVEGEHWPALLSHARRRGLPIAVVNGRFGDSGWRRWEWFRWLPRRPAARFLFGAVHRFGLQTEQDRARFAELGVEAARLQVTGNVKFDAREGVAKPGLEERLEALAAGRPILIAGSTMDGEEPQVLAAFRACGGGERAMLLLAPRHKERWDDVAGLLDSDGSSWLRRSRLGEEGTDAAAVPERPAAILLDSYGELSALYRLAAAAFVGGTLVGTGGHNPVEPALFGVPIAIGPSMDNFRDMAARFDKASAWCRVGSALELGRAWGELIADRTRAREIGARGKALVEENRGATARTLALLEPLLAGRR